MVLGLEQMADIESHWLVRQALETHTSPGEDVSSKMAQSTWTISSKGSEDVVVIGRLSDEVRLYDSLPDGSTTPV